jgi:hypothetical protein
MGYTNLANSDIANGCPSTSAIANWGMDLAAGSMASIIQALNTDIKRLKDKGMKLRITLMTDHGNRKGVDHLVKVLLWASVDEKTGRRYIRRFNLDIDEAGHKTKEVVDAIALSLTVLGIGVQEVDFILSNITGDRGGGGAVQSIHPELVKLGTMPETSTFLNCMLHAMNKALETASTETLGTQGLNNNSCFQLVYQAVMLLASIKKQGGMDLLKDYYSKTLTEFWNNPEWQERAAENFVQAFDEMTSELEQCEDLSDESVDKLVQHLSCPTNVPHPNFGRWGSVSASSKVVVKHWSAFYFLAQVILNTDGSNSYIGKIAKSLLDLMDARADIRSRKHRRTMFRSYGSMGFVMPSLMSTWSG